MKKLLLLTAAVLILTNCDSWTDCIINNGPQLNQRVFVTGFSNVYYEDSLNAEINNDPQDNNYYYYFSVRGLPRGMDYESEGRELFIYGTPQESGRFNLEVYLHVEAAILYYDENDGPFEDGDTLCKDSTSRLYTLTIQ
ncbi:hypothetical protein F0365_15900 [Nonlabens sp. Ci31]|jgi:hypothetical protein|uniref:hypothetical protein n=1 Tax=Nonlabens sp. Ci31 TaxID=2608253 RepID=UPI0014645FF1|nr:hypothetical protein [Nonlabens sp. Ci31]QJP35777.1 hypothetical protein F0365_15900 [Nonlabens sp. Ci31]